MSIKSLLKANFFYFSQKAVAIAVKQDADLSEMWDLSLKHFPDLVDHYATVKMNDEALMRVRLLICSEALWLKRVITGLKKQGVDVKNYVDIGDSDGSARLLFEKSMKNCNIDSLGINIQPEAVEKIKAMGLNAECIDAMDLPKRGRRYDAVSVFETLEHLPHPIGFMQNMSKIINKRLIISVPLIVKSRVSLKYLTGKWEREKTPTIANNHIFELSPEDWTKIFLHTGWQIEDQWHVRQYPKRGLLKVLMQYAWRKLSFEGYWFVSLKKDDTYSSQYIMG